MNPLILKPSAPITDKQGLPTREFFTALYLAFKTQQDAIAAKASLTDKTKTLAEQLAAVISTANAAAAAVNAPFLVGVVLTQAADPSTDDLPAGYFALYDSPAGTCLWANVAGVLKSVALT